MKKQLQNYFCYYDDDDDHNDGDDDIPQFPVNKAYFY